MFGMEPSTTCSENTLSGATSDGLDDNIPIVPLVSSIMSDPILFSWELILAQKATDLKTIRFYLRFILKGTV